MKIECKIVQDLLPTYIESMTSGETTGYVKEHIDNCKECKEIYDNMKSQLEKEEVENTEIIQDIKKYRKRIIFIKLISSTIIISIILGVIINIGYKFWILKNTYEKNINYEAYGNFTLEEYYDSIERYEKHYTTYYKDGKMKKIYGDDVIEYYDGENHYYFDNENKTYWIDNKVKIDDKLNIDIYAIPEMNNIVVNNKISNLQILKFVMLKKDLVIQKEAFRNKEYYVIKNFDGQKVYIDEDTFFAERVEKENNETGKKEYRVTTANVSWIEMNEPDFSKYTLIEK